MLLDNVNEEREKDGRPSDASTTIELLINVQVFLFVSTENENTHQRQFQLVQVWCVAR